MSELKPCEAIEILESIYPSKKQIVTGEYPEVAEALDMAIAAIRRAQPAEPLTCAGYDIDGLMITAELLRKYNVRPENLLDLCKNMKSCYEMVQRDIEDSFKRAMMQATDACPNSEIDAHKPGGEQE